jgi:hypothetical protein
VENRLERNRDFQFVLDDFRLPRVNGRGESDRKVLFNKVYLFKFAFSFRKHNDISKEWLIWQANWRDALVPLTFFTKYAETDLPSTLKPIGPE